MDLDSARERLRLGGLRGAELLEWLAATPVAERDRAFEALLGIDDYSREVTAPGDDLIGYVPSGVSAIVRAVFETPITRADVFVDLGAGLGKAAMGVHLLTGARAVGIEIDAGLVARATARAGALGLTRTELVAADARDARLDDGTVFFLYLPFTGAALRVVLDRLRAVATMRPIVVCALGIDLRGTEDFLAPRETDGFWLTIYDAKVVPAPNRQPLPLSPEAEAVALERSLPLR